MTAFFFFQTTLGAGRAQLPWPALFRKAALSCLAGAALVRGAAPLEGWLKALHDGVRDEQFLVGLVLNDYHRPRPPRAKSSERERPASPVSAAGASAFAAASNAASNTASATAAAAAAAGSGL